MARSLYMGSSGFRLVMMQLDKLTLTVEAAIHLLVVI